MDLDRREAHERAAAAERSSMYVSGLRGMLNPAEKALGDFVDVKALKKASSTTPRSR